MLFNSTEFLVFFPLVCALYFLAPPKWRWLLLLVASCVFYMFFVPVYILILAFTIAVDYTAGILIENSTGRKRKRFLVLSVIANVGVLACFKYWNFLNGNIGEAVRSMGFAYHIPDLGILLPIGLSFHTFQSLSYTVEVYRGDQPAERHPGFFALYVMFFPQLVAGPIERPGALLPQLHRHHSFTYENLLWGLTKMAYGYFKKVVVADRLAAYVETVYGDVGAHTSWAVWLAAFFFAIQIYCDFSGYSDIAIGTARILGVDLMENFRRPYLSASIGEFWRKWHISLSSWLRDYIYLPLGGNRVVKWRWYYNIVFTFMLSGLWHGANWTYIVFGTMHGVFLVLSNVTRVPVNAAARAVGLYTVPRLHHMLNVLATFGLCVFALVIFRASSLAHAGSIFERMLSFEGTFGLRALSIRGEVFPVIGCLFVTLLLALSYLYPFDLKLKRPRTFIVMATMLIIILGRHGGDFFYFQF